VKPAPVEYRSAASVEEALALLAEAGADGKALAGGQSLVPLLNMRILRPSVLVDLNGVAALDTVEAADGAIRVGAMVRQGALERSPLVRAECPLLAECLPLIGHFATRNRGTIGGSIAHADAGGELPVALVTLGGSVVVQSPRGRREIAAENFFVTHFTTALEPDELVVETVWPAAAPSTGFAFEELAQRHGDYALAMAACALSLVDGEVAEARLCLGAVTDRPTLVDVFGIEGEAVVETARAAVEPVGTIHASPEYLRHVTGVLAERAVLRARRNAFEVSA
jgi:CO/xanthine dehydrogenase FAD-binding subunit